MKWTLEGKGERWVEVCKEEEIKETEVGENYGIEERRNWWNEQSGQENEKVQMCFFKKKNKGIPWQSSGSIPGRGAKIPQATMWGQKNPNQNNKQTNKQNQKKINSEATMCKWFCQDPDRADQLVLFSYLQEFTVKSGNQTLKYGKT